MPQDVLDLFGRALLQRGPVVVRNHRAMFTFINLSGDAHALDVNGLAAQVDEQAAGVFAAPLRLVDDEPGTPLPLVVLVDELQIDCPH